MDDLKDTDPGSPANVDAALERGKALQRNADRTLITIGLSTEGPKGGMVQTLKAYTDDEPAIVEMQTKVIGQLANLIDVPD